VARRGRAAARSPGERVQKILAMLGLASRREAEGWIRAGRVTINGQAAELGARARPEDQIRLDGRLIRRRTKEAPGVFICHRSPGDPLASIIERLPRRAGRRFIAVSPMPKIDGALELVTANGTLAARLQRTVRGMSSEFSARVHGELNDAQLDAIRKGVLPTASRDRSAANRIVVERIEAVAGSEGANRWYEIAARGVSGKDVRQLLEQSGALVGRVLRTRLGPIALDRGLPRGRFRELTSAEVETLLAVEASPGDPSASGTQ
jgi:23S rRNA pseudouridine2605 synthase